MVDRRRQLKTILGGSVEHLKDLDSQNAVDSDI